MQLSITNPERGSAIYRIEKDGLVVNQALGNWQLTARLEESKSGWGPSVRVLFWNPATKPDQKGRIFPKKSVILSYEHPTKTVKRGLFGFSGTLRLDRVPTTDVLSSVR